MKASVANRAQSLLDDLDVLLQKAVEGSTQRKYSQLDKESKGRPVITTGLEDDSATGPREKKFRAPTSMRDVEPSVHVWVFRKSR